MIECYCDADPPKVWESTRPKAAKDHRCCECGGVIKRGETHEAFRGLWDGGWHTYRTCADCLHIRCETGCSCYEFGDLGEVVRGSERLSAMFRAVKRERSA